MSLPDGNYRDALWPELLARIPEILTDQDPETGRFGTEPFISTDQNVLWPLAVAWARPAPADGPVNRYFHDPDLLSAIVAGGDALLEICDEQGKFEFRKKDNSTWGQIYMPWIYSRWIRAWGLIRDAMPPDRRQAWDAALTRACDGIVATELIKPVQNIPAHHAMGVFRASQVLGRDDWAQAAVDYLHRTIAEQDRGGFWSEHHGPVVLYNYVYVDLLGLYYGMSGDPVVQEPLERAADFHAHLTYPDATIVETIDERNYYRGGIASASVGFSVSPLGRRYLRWLLDRHRAAGAPISADTVASLIAYGAADDPVADQAAATVVPAEQDRHQFVLGERDGLVRRRAPWHAVVSAYDGPSGPARWFQDRQAHLSVFHDRTGLIVSGSNTRLQPRWSTFTVGDPALLAHRPGDEDPDFSAAPGLQHVPDAATLQIDHAGVDLDYASIDGGDEIHCRAEVRLPEAGGEPAVIHYRLETPSEHPVAAHAGLVAHLGEAWQAGERSGTLDEQPLRLTGAECGGSFSHHGWTISVPSEAVIEWPVLPHNPYAKDGAARLDVARIVVSLPLGPEPQATELSVTV